MTRPPSGTLKSFRGSKTRPIVSSQLSLRTSSNQRLRTRTTLMFCCVTRSRIASIIVVVLMIIHVTLQGVLPSSRVSQSHVNNPLPKVFIFIQLKKGWAIIRHRPTQLSTIIRVGLFSMVGALAVVYVSRSRTSISLLTNGVYHFSLGLVFAFSAANGPFDVMLAVSKYCPSLFELHATAYLPTFLDSPRGNRLHIRHTRSSYCSVVNLLYELLLTLYLLLQDLARRWMFWRWRWKNGSFHSQASEQQRTTSSTRLVRLNAGHTHTTSIDLADSPLPKHPPISKDSSSYLPRPAQADYYMPKLPPDALCHDPHGRDH